MNNALEFNRLKKDLLAFTKAEVAKFLTENPTLTFYAFAYDCNAEYGEVNLCFNTEEAFSKSLEECRNGRFSESYQTEQEVEELRYNTGDWDYQCFSTMYVMEEEEITKLYRIDELDGDDFDAAVEQQTNDFMTIFRETLLDFSLTEEYRKIPKTDDFKIICIDHDEDMETAESRLNDAKKTYLKTAP